NRWAPVWRNAVRPVERVPDAFLARGRNRVRIDGALDAGALVRALRSRRFRVTRFESDGATYLFADRLAWAHFGTFASHLSLILLLAGVLVSRFGTVEERHLIAEGETAGVFSAADPRHLQVRVDRAVAEFDAEGRARDFRTFITVQRNGAVVKQGV